MTFLDPRVTPIVALLALGGGLLLLIRKAMKVETHIIDEEGIQVAWRRDTAGARLLVNHLAAHGIDARALAAAQPGIGRGRVAGVGVFVEPEKVSAAAKLLAVEHHADQSGAV